MMYHSIQTLYSDTLFRHKSIFAQKFPFRQNVKAFAFIPGLTSAGTATEQAQVCSSCPDSSWEEAQCEINSHCFHLGSPRQVGGKFSYITEGLSFKCVLRCIISPQHCRRPRDTEGLLLQRFQELLIGSHAVL